MEAGEVSSTAASNPASRHYWAAPGHRIGEQRELDEGGNKVDWLIDNAEAYDALIGAMREARESIWISQLAFDSDCKAYASDGAGPEADIDYANLLDSILMASSEQGVRVKILLNSTLLLDTRRPLLRFLAGSDLDTDLLEVRGISRFPQLLHAKIVIIDERRAFLMGSPFVNGYWDTPRHAPVDNRRPRRELGGRPIHDVSVGVHGPAVYDLAKIFARLWNGAAHPELDHATRLEPGVFNRGTAQNGLQMVTTEPPGRQVSDSGSRETLNALLDGIQRARSLIYIEHQYLSSRPVVKALRQALDRERSLEIIIVLNQNPDVTAYRRWQNARLRETGLLAHARVGVFALWSAETRIGSFGPDVNQVFVHSKVVVIDDEWAMVGSANLDGVSLGSYGDDFSGRLARRVFRNVRNFDVSMVLTARDSAREPNPIREWRERLWMEHLGNRAQAVEGRTDAQLPTWKALASRNVTWLNGLARSDPARLGGSFILPYSTSPTPRAQLADAGVRPAAAIQLRFDPGWLEVHCSPNWIRNMFL